MSSKGEVNQSWKASRRGAVPRPPTKVRKLVKKGESMKKKTIDECPYDYEMTEHNYSGSGCVWFIIFWLIPIVIYKLV